MSYNFLDKAGLTYFWSKIKAKLAEKVDIVGNLTVSRHPSSSGYLKFAECDLSRGGYGNKYVVLFMTTEYATNGKDGNGIVYINIRGNGTGESSVSNFYWLLNDDSTSVDTLYWAVSDHKVEFYRKVFAANEYAQVSFKVLHIGNFENAKYWTFELNNVPFVEGTPLDTPIGDVHAIVSGGKVKNAENAERATGDKNGKDITSTYISYTTSSQSVVGNTKNVSKISPETIYVPNGLIMGGTAQAAGLVTRGICGIGSPNEYGACAKENLYINYDGNNNFNAGRQIVSSAGAIGNHLGSNMYQYTLPRGEIVKNWVEAKGYTTNTGTITGINMNGASKGTTGVVDLGTVITSHQSLADRAVNKTLTNENLNNVTTPGFYNAGGGNTCTNKPTGVDHFGLYVVHRASGSYYTQRIFNDTTQFTRKCVNGTWGSWSEDKLTDTTYSSKAAASGGTDVSLVTTGEKYAWNNKQNALATQTAYTSKGSATKVPQITTNTLGQVTGISEVTITQPTVNNGTLTIQKNGTNVQTFSANQSGNATANITVPTKVSDLNNDSNFTSKTYVDNAVAANRGAENPIATILAYAGSEAPNGYLLCRGQAVSRTTYSLLFDAIGTQYGDGDGSTTFNIPDLQGKVITGLDIVDEDFNVLGKTGGSKTVQLTKNQLPKINGSFTMHGAGTSTNISSVAGDFTSDYNNTKYKNGGTEVSGAGSKGNVKLVIGNNEAHENKQPYNTLNYIIKAYSGTDVPVPVESSSVKNSYDDSIANVYSTNYINTKVRGKKLWTNPNPTSNFAAQTITFDETNDYDFYKIKAKAFADSESATFWQDVEVGDLFNLLITESYTPDIENPNIKGHILTTFRKNCSCNHNSITFTNAIYYTSIDSTKSVNDTSHCIPLEIYGYYI